MLLVLFYPVFAKSDRNPDNSSLVPSCLKNNLKIKERDRTFCDDISTQK